MDIFIHAFCNGPDSINRFQLVFQFRKTDSFNGGIPYENIE
jgi:hypothetical protein